MRTWLTAVSFGLAIAAAIFLLIVPTYSGSYDGGPVTHPTLVEVNGSWVIIPVFFPPSVALLPLIFRKQAVRIIATILIGGFVFIAGFSIGLFYLPAAVMMLLAACVSPSAKVGVALR